MLRSPTAKPDVFDPYGGIRPDDRFDLAAAAPLHEGISDARIQLRRSLLAQFDDARRRMLVLRDVQPVKFTHDTLNPAVSAREAVRQLFGAGKLSEGDRVVLTHGDHIGKGGGTNTLKLLSVGADGMVESLRDL